MKNLLIFLFWLPTHIKNFVLGVVPFNRDTYKPSSEYERREEQRARNLQRSIDYDLKRFTLPYTEEERNGGRKD